MRILLLAIKATSARLRDRCCGPPDMKLSVWTRIFLRAATFGEPAR